MPNYSYLVLTSAVAGREAEYDAWSEARHVDDVLAVPGFVSARRFRAAVPQPASSPPRWHYALLYEMDADSADASFAELSRRVGGELMPMSDSPGPKPDQERDHDRLEKATDKERGAAAWQRHAPASDAARRPSPGDRLWRRADF